MGSFVTMVIRTGCLTSPSTLTRITANQLPGTVMFVGIRTRQPGVGVGVEVAVTVGDSVAAGVGSDGSGDEIGVGVRVDVGSGGVDDEVGIGVRDGSGVDEEVGVAVKVGGSGVAVGV